MSALTVNLPDNLHEKAREVAASKNLSMDALVTIALTQSLSRLVVEPLLEERAVRATGKGITEFLAQVPEAAPPKWDQLPEGYQRKQRG
jgi:plasmid stability protein